MAYFSTEKNEENGSFYYSVVRVFSTQPGHLYLC